MVVATLRNLQVCVIHLYSLSPALTGVASGSFRLGFPVFPSGCENPYRSSNGSAGCPASVPRPSLVCKRLGPGTRLGGPGYPEHQGSAPGGKRARRRRGNQLPPVSVTGLFLSNESTIEPTVGLLALVLREASRDR